MTSTRAVSDAFDAVLNGPLAAEVGGEWAEDG
jgi:hypothetical protein